MWIVITMLPPVPVMYAAFVLLGIGRGAVSILNNAVVNDNSDGKPAALNLLHMTFAVGAFLSPFLTSCYISAGLSWRAVAYTVVAGSSFAWLFYAMMKIDYNYAEKKRDTEKVKEVYYKNPIFYIMGFLLFLYLGLENCVNGWFVTYFKSMGIMSGAYATNLVSVTWVMVMLGRLLTAKLSTKIHKNKLIFSYCVATAVFFLLLIATKNLVVITIAIAGLGFFFAGIYPTSVSSVGKILKGSTTGMSMLLAMAALGGIVTPQIVGIAADGFGMAAAILLLGINAAGMLILSLVNMKINKE
jgi:fucose permease